MYSDLPAFERKKKKEKDGYLFLLIRTFNMIPVYIIYSFHVGSGCFDANAFSEATIRARKIFDVGESLGFRFSLLDGEFKYYFSVSLFGD